MNRTNPGLIGVIICFAFVATTEMVPAQIRPTPELRRSVTRFLDAIEQNDLTTVRTLSTKRGYQFVVRAVNNHREAGRILDIIGTSSIVSRIRWWEITPSVARGRVRWVTIQFVFEQGKWKFDAASAA